MNNLPTQMIYAAMTEVVEVHSCGPGLIQLGEGENIVCIDPNDPFGGGHDGGGGPPGGGRTSRASHCQRRSSRTQKTSRV